MEKIKQITEAFSMQPKVFYVTDEPQGYTGEVKEIKLEKIILGDENGNSIEDVYYVGYDFNDKKIFQFLAKTVNVEFDVR
jgi:hypothetical protein